MSIFLTNIIFNNSQKDISVELFLLVKKNACVS